MKTLTLNELIAKLEWLKDQVGGDVVVKVCDGDEMYDFSVHHETIEEEASETGVSSVVMIDTTG